MGNGLTIELFNQAVDFSRSIPLDTMTKECRMFRGVKIEKCKSTSEVEAFNCLMGGDDYSPLKPQEKANLLAWGWEAGATIIAIESYRKKLERVERDIAECEKKKRNRKSLRHFNEKKKFLSKRFKHLESELLIIKSKYDGSI